jgi:mycothiol synthase
MAIWARRLIRVRIGTVELRPPTTADAEAVLALLSACDLADLGEVNIEMADVLEGWDEVDLAREGRFAAGVAYAMRGEDLADLYVRPEHRGRGLEAELLDFLEAGSHAVVLEVSDRYAELRALLAERGYAMRSSAVRMWIDLSARRPAPAWPDGFAPRSFRPGVDDEAVHAVIAPGMHEVDGIERPLATWRERMLGRDRFSPAGSVVVEDPDGGVAAAAVCELWDDGVRGAVRQLAVRPERRGLGLGAATLAAAFDALAAAGARDAVLGVHDHNPGARRLYERAGMTPLFRGETWARA